MRGEVDFVKDVLEEIYDDENTPERIKELCRGAIHCIKKVDSDFSDLQCTLSRLSEAV